MPPLVHYKIPIIGQTYSYLFNSEEFLKQCKKEYGDIFSIYVWGQVITIVGKEHSQDILSKEDSFNFGMAKRIKIPLDIILKDLMTLMTIRSVVYSPEKMLKNILNNLDLYSERTQKSLYLAIQKYIEIGDNDEQKVFYNIYYLMSKIISTSIANLYIGEEESKYEEVVTTFADFSSCISKFLIIPPLLDFIYPGFFSHTLLRLGLYNPVIKSKDILIKHIKKQVYKRLQEKAEYGDSWKRPDDLLQDIIEQDSINLNNVNYPLLADKILALLLPSIHTTSSSCANVLMDLASQPQYMQELYEEQLEVHKEMDEDGVFPLEAFDNMKKLDSFIRESLRLNGSIIGLEHFVLKDYTFSNGLQVPKYRLVNIYLDDIYQDELLQGTNPKSFKPFRHVDANVPASKIGKNFMSFGGGKHACPGRHFAINEIKYIMHYVILTYNIRTESGKMEERKMYGPTAIPSSSGIIFEKRI